ncbi:RadC family protein [Macrococcoides bohemicum]|uniref:RadC family protein n=1 Tax=Macrococcoides bohemicum TaxID=1903056 RepID=UPI001FD52858|nr:DNA repair protein RadC [Macrococcus bohemicus]
MKKGRFLVLKDDNYIYSVTDIKQNYRKTKDERFKIKSPADVIEFLRKKIGKSAREHFIVIGLNTKNEVLFSYVAFIGSLNASIVHPRETFQVAILNSCANIIVAHNHPSGDVSPSYEDREATNRLVQAGEILGIDVLDHIIVTQDNDFSFRENNYI